jgi:putative oxidoreductase
LVVLHNKNELEHLRHTGIKIIIMKKWIFETNNDWTGFVLRLTLALVMIPHTIQHTTGGLGGYGYTGMMGFFTQSLHIPVVLAFLVIVTEVVTPMVLLLGFGTRFASSALILLMVGIIITSHHQFGFFMNWLGNQKGEGFEYHLLYIGLALASVLNGSGKYSLDAVIFRQATSNHKNNIDLTYSAGN